MYDITVFFFTNSRLHKQCCLHAQRKASIERQLGVLLMRKFLVNTLLSLNELLTANFQLTSQTFHFALTTQSAKLLSYIR